MKSRILKISGIALLILIIFVCTAPYLFKGKIIRLVKAHAEKELSAHIHFTDMDISLFRHFPRISIGLDSLQVTCVGEFQDDTLLSSKQFDLVCDPRSLISGDSIAVYSITLNEPRIHALTHKNGYSNWNIINNHAGEMTDSSIRSFNWGIQHYAIHKGYINYQDEKRDMHIVVYNLEHAGTGNFSAERFALKTKTTADAIDFDLTGAIPYRITAKTRMDMVFHVDSKTHTYSFNTDQISFNDMKLHTEGFFQWINDSSYNMDIRYKVPSTKFKDILSMLPSVYQKDFTSIETNGQVNFNGFIKGKYDEKHSPAYHTNLYIINGFFKYPDLPVPVENIRFGLQVDNPDGMADHLTVNVTGAHVEINKDTLDLHLLVKNLKSKPFIDFAFVGKLDLANISKWKKLDPGTRLSGLINTDIRAKGNIPETEKQKKDIFQASGNFELENFSYVSTAFPGGLAVNELLMNFNPKNILVKELKGEYLSTHMDATGTLNNLFDFALKNRPLQATMSVQADELNFRDWIKANQGMSPNGNSLPVEIPDNMDLTIHANAGKLHFDNLDLQDLTGDLVISDQKIQLQQVKAKGMDGEISIDGLYSTSIPGENPEITFTYDVKGMDIQKTFLAFNSLRKIMPVAKFMAGNFNAHMILNGRVNGDMTPDLQTLQGEGNVQVPIASIKDFGPLDKLSDSLDLAILKNIPLKEVNTAFSFKTGRVTVNPFLIQTKEIVMEIAGTHGFDQSLDYKINLNVLRGELGSKGNLFIKNVVNRAADKGIPVALHDFASMHVAMNGTINSPDVKTDMDDVVDNAATDLKKEIDDFVAAKLDSAKHQLDKHPATAKKPLYIQTAYTSKNRRASKKHTAPANKKTVHSKKKKKSSYKHYTRSMKKEDHTVSSK